MDRNIITVSFLVLWLFIAPSHAHAAEITHAVISQLQVAGTSATDEWVELYNPTSNAIDLSPYSLQYKSATGSTFQKKNFSNDATIAAHGYYLISHTSAGVASSADMTHSTFSMSATGGNIYLVSTQIALPSSTDPTIIDRLGYGTGNAPEGTASAAPASSQSLERKPGGTLGNGTDTDSNISDFQLNAVPFPRTSHSQPQPPIDTPASDSPAPDSSSPSNDSSPTPPTSTIRINELLPRPNATDKEWIEFVFSGNPFSLTGYTIEDGTGTILTLDATPTGAFFVVELNSTKLNNDGDTVILKTPDNTIVDRVTYGSFDDGDPNNNAVAPAEGMTLNRFPDGNDSDSDVVDWFVSKQPTKGSVNNIIAPPASSSTTTTVTARTNGTSPTDPLPLVFINEFVSDPADGDTEWVEIINMESRPILLDGWSLENSFGTIIQLSGQLGAADSNRHRVITMLKGGLQNNGDVIILWDSTRRQVDRVPYGIWNAQPTTNAPIARDPYSVARIVDGYSSGNLIKDFVVTTTPTQGQRNTITLPTRVSLPTNLNAPIALPLTRPTTQFNEGDVLINELLPNPVGEDHGREWIELITRSQTPITIESLIIDVRNGARHTLPSITISPSTPILLKNEDLPPLPNAGATLRLLVEHHDDNNRIVEKELDRVSYTAALNEGQSYGITSDGRWQWSTTPTPGIVNIRSAPNQPPTALFVAPATAPQGAVILFDASDSFDPDHQPLTYTWAFSDGSTSHGIAIQKELPALKKLTATLTVSDGSLSSTASDTVAIQLPQSETSVAPTSTQTRTSVVALERVALADIKNLERNTKVLTQGIVSAPSGTLPDGAFALSGSGVIVKLSGRQSWPTLTLGDTVQVAGAISVTQTGSSIRVTHPNQITILAHGPAPSPVPTTISDALEREDNDLVTIAGTLRDVRAKSWLVEDEENEIVVLPPTGLERTATEGESVMLTGIIEHTKTSNRLRLRFSDDAQFQQPAPATTTIVLPTHKPSKLPLIAFASVLAVSLLALITYPRSGQRAPLLEPLPETIINQEGSLQISGSFQSEKTTL